MKYPTNFEPPASLPKEVRPFECIYVPIGTYAIVDSETNIASVRARILTTGGFMECVGPLASVVEHNG